MRRPNVRTLDIAPLNFHPRFSATERWYRYRISQSPGPSPLKARYSWNVGPDLDTMKMNRAASHLIGSHDFASFGQSPQGDKTVRSVFEARWQQQPPPSRYAVAQMTVGMELQSGASIAQ